MMLSTVSWSFAGAPAGAGLWATGEMPDTAMKTAVATRQIRRMNV
jgi:hypothetical protein